MYVATSNFRTNLCTLKANEIESWSLKKSFEVRYVYVPNNGVKSIFDKYSYIS